MCFPPFQCSLSDPEDERLLTLYDSQEPFSKPPDSVWSWNYSLQLAPPSSLSKIKFMSHMGHGEAQLHVTLRVLGDHSHHQGSICMKTLRPSKRNGKKDHGN